MSNVTFFALFLGLISSHAFALEKIGEFSVDEARVRGSYLSTETQGGVFKLNDSQFAVRWRKDKHVSAFFAVGDIASRNLPIYYSDTNPSQLGFVDAYAQYEGVYGRIRAGILPLNFGYYGSINPANRYFHYDQVFSRRMIGLHDEGVSFQTEYAGFYTEAIVHNGNVDQPNDGRPWVTSNFGYTNSRDVTVQASLQTGWIPGDMSAPPAGTTTRTFNVAGINNGETARWRNGSVFVNYYPRNWNFVIEIGGGQMAQDSTVGRYEYDVAEASYFFSQNFGSGLRYDFFDPNLKTSADGKTEYSVLLIVRSDDGSSNFMLEGTKRVEESNEIHDDQLRVTWLLTPFAH